MLAFNTPSDLYIKKLLTQLGFFSSISNSQYAFVIIQSLKPGNRRPPNL